jgi:hypothetical protein
MLLLVCGWPSCGKTHFGQWLEATRDFRHVDLEEPESDAQEIFALWEKQVPDAAPKFVATLRKQHPRWVLTWGAPADCMPKLEAMRAAGFEPWFLLPASDQRSRQEWLQRAREKDPDVRPSIWDKKANEIRKGARELRRFFRDRCIESLSSHGERMPCEVLAEKMNVAAATAGGSRRRANA